MEIQNKDAALKSQIAIRCARAAILLLSLRCSGNGRLDSMNDNERNEREIKLAREAEDLKRKLVRERAKNRRMRLRSATELLLQEALLLSLCTLCFALAFRISLKVTT